MTRYEIACNIACLGCARGQQPEWHTFFHAGEEEGDGARAHNSPGCGWTLCLAPTLADFAEKQAEENEQRKRALKAIVLLLRDKVYIRVVDAFNAAFEIASQEYLEKK